jgi:putative transposase
MARIVIPGIPHHVTQRGNRRQLTFFCEEDYERYKALMATWCRKRGVDVWAYCLMPNHVHLVAVPETESALRSAIGEAHRRYTCAVNDREGWRGHLWQGRFASYPMDPRHLLHCARYVELNPVRAALVSDPADWPHSSAGAHLGQRHDGLVNVAPLLERIDDWRGFLTEPQSDEMADDLRAHETTGRPLGDPRFVERLERILGRQLRPRRPGPRTQWTPAPSGGGRGWVSPKLPAPRVPGN